MAERFSQGSDAFVRGPRLGTAQRLRGLARVPVWLACAGALACATSPPPAPGSVRGHLIAPRVGAAPPSEPMLVFLEPLDPAGAAPKDAQHPVLRLGEQGFAPLVLAVPAGHSLRLANETEIYHRIFSYSESNPFDLGVLRRGDAGSIELAKPGLVRIYCSLHPSERAIVFVAPSPYFTTFLPPAAYLIRDVPPGRYRLHAWSESSSATSRAVTVPSGASVAASIAARPGEGE